MNKISLSGKWIQIILHILLWAILIIIPLYLASRYGGNRRFFRWFFYKDVVIYGILFYTNYLILVPRLFFKGKRLRYAIIVVALIAGFYFISYFPHEYLAKRPEMGQNFEPQRDEPGGPRPVFRLVHGYSYTLTSVVIIFLSLGLGSLNRQTQIEKRQKELEKEKLNSELAFLKSQISPHFFFNTLNNIYALIGTNTRIAQDSVHKLSKLMRYLLYESEQGKAPLSSEIDFMNNYIDLMKLRLSEKVTLNISFPGDFEDFLIPPLLFIPFIENAFKHGISYRDKSFINISIEVIDKTIIFKSENSLAKMPIETTEQLPGIGLENIRKRLNLLFPGSYQLTTEKTKESYNVYLKINAENTSV